ncbi:hypothetical protein [Sutcliffiella sp. FSL R7-0096]
MAGEVARNRRSGRFLDGFGFTPVPFALSGFVTLAGVKNKKKH